MEPLNQFQIAQHIDVAANGLRGDAKLFHQLLGRDIALRPDQFQNLFLPRWQIGDIRITHIGPPLLHSAIVFASCKSRVKPAPPH